MKDGLRQLFEYTFYEGPALGHPVPLRGELLSFKQFFFVWAHYSYYVQLSKKLTSLSHFQILMNNVRHLKVWTLFPFDLSQYTFCPVDLRFLSFVS